jgi:hypothetical protein
MARAEDSSFSPGLALPVGSLVVPTTSADFGTCGSEAGWGCSRISRAGWCYPSGCGASCGCFISSGAPPSSACPKILVCGPRADVEGACDSGTTLSALVCPRTCCSVMAVLGGGGVAPPDSSSGLWVDVELHKSITSYKGDDIEQLCYTHTSSRYLQVYIAEYGGKPRFLRLPGFGTLLCCRSGGRDWLSHVASNSGSRLWDS